MDGGVPLPFATVARTHRDDEFGEWSMHVRAVAITKPGNPDGMEVIDAPDPSPGPDEVVVATEAIGVGGVDVVVRRGEIATPPDGWIPGGEVVGRVVSIGTAVDPAWLGMRVWSYTGITAQHPDAGALLPDGLSSIDGGGYAELAVAPANELTVVPDELSSVDAAALGSPLPVGHFALAHARFRRGDSLLVRGAAGSIGIATVELAARAGASSIAVTTSSDGRGTRLRELGATHVLDRAGRGDTSAPESYDVIVDIAGGSAVPASSTAWHPTDDTSSPASSPECRPWTSDARSSRPSSSPVRSRRSASTRCRWRTGAEYAPNSSTPRRATSSTPSSTT